MSLLAETKFALSLLKESPVEESYVISPLSISLALALLHSGAEGSTKKQIQKAIADDDGLLSNLLSSDKSLIKYYKTLSEDLLKESEVIVRIANRIFIKNGFKVNQSYLDRIGKNYSAKAEVLNFNKRNECVKVVNGFVEEATGGKIKEIVAEGDFEGAVTIIVNALYFDAEWATFFNTKSTREGDFYVKPGVTKKVQFMHQWESWWGDYASSSDCKVLSLKYKDPDYRFFILLPNESSDLASFRESLTPRKVQNLMKSVRDSWLNITIPKFKIEIETNLKQVLEKIGITEIFSSDAKLDGIGKGINVSEIKHKAFIEVDESGTRAAAVTYSCLKQCNLGPGPGEFKANRPFIYVLSYKNHIIFTGQYCGS